MPTLMASTYKRTAAASRCQVKKKNAASAPRWKAIITERVSQLTPSPVVAARPMRTSSRAGTVYPSAAAAALVISGIGRVGSAGVGGGGVATDAMIGEDPYGVATRPPLCSIVYGASFVTIQCSSMSVMQ